MLVCFVGGKLTDLVQLWLETEARGVKALGSPRAAQECERGPAGLGCAVPAFLQPAQPLGRGWIPSQLPAPALPYPFLPLHPSSRLCCIPGLLLSVPRGVTEPGLAQSVPGAAPAPALPWEKGSRGRVWFLGVWLEPGALLLGRQQSFCCLWRRSRQIAAIAV